MALLMKSMMMVDGLEMAKESESQTRKHRRCPSTETINDKGKKWESSALSFLPEEVKKNRNQNPHDVQKKINMINLKTKSLIMPRHKLS